LRLRYTRTALRQIEEALSYIHARSPQGAAGLRERILAAVDLLQDYPLAGQATSRQKSRRLVPTPYPYVLFYRVAAKEVVISRLRHTARRPLPQAR
jgi:toxin ParE1/3/4